MKKIIAFLLFACALNAGPRLAHSSLNSPDGFFVKYDKAEHFGGSFVLCEAIYGLGIPNKKAAWATLSFGLAWEIKDAFVPDEKYGPMGGDGFCFLDLTADAVGVLASYLVNKYVLN